MSTPVDTRYRNQWGRVGRLSGRLKAAGFSSSEDAVNAHDDAISFFMHCFHLGDWLKKSGVMTKDDWDKFFGESGPMHMRLCRDICNGAKHLELTRPPSFHRDSKVGLSVTAGIFGNENEYRIEIFVKNKTYSLEDIAGRCMEEWRHFLVERNLISVE